jgi:DNA-binding MarR family transcriptional regulator
MFGEPAWDILLALYVIDRDQRRLSTRQVTTLAGQPLTTALRWLDYLEQQELVERGANPFDQRVVYVELSARGRAAMDEYLTQLNETDIFGPVPSGDL